MEETITQRIRAVLKDKRISINAFSEENGLKQRTVYNQITGVTPLTIDIFLAVVKAFPEISTDWFLLGREPMFRNAGVNQSTINGDNIQGNHAVVNKGDCAKFIEMLQEKDRQIAELIEIIKNK